MMSKFITKRIDWVYNMSIAHAIAPSWILLFILLAMTGIHGVFFSRMIDM